MENIIKTRFNKSSNTYDDACTIQRVTNKALLATLLKHKPSNKPLCAIADVGCGTGNSTALLLDTYQYKIAYAIDIAEKLLHIARNKLKAYPVSFIQATFNVAFGLSNLNLIYSNMALHWATNLEKTINILYNSLKHKGFLSFSIPMAGTFIEINDACRNTFFSFNAIKTISENIGFSLVSMHQQTFIDKFTSPICALNSIKKIGANSLLSPQKKKGLSNKNLYTRIFKQQNVFNLTYEVGFFILQK